MNFCQDKQICKTLFLMSGRAVNALWQITCFRQRYSSDSWRQSCSPQHLVLPVHPLYFTPRLFQ